MTAVLSQIRPLDYAPCRYAGVPVFFRGPQRALTGDYIACIGATETFGKYIEAPYPALVERATGMTCVNLGCQNAGIDAFMTQPALLDICAGAQATVIQIMAASNMSNRHYTVDPGHNDRFLRASRTLKAIYPEVDFARVDRIDRMLTTLARVCPTRLHSVRREVQSAWVARMRSLIGTIGGEIILLWLADHPPYSRAQGGTICRDPVFVDRAMLDAVTGPRVTLAEVVLRRDDLAAGLHEMVFPAMELDQARAMLGPVAHRRAAERLAPLLGALCHRPENHLATAKD